MSGVVVWSEEIWWFMCESWTLVSQCSDDLAAVSEAGAGEMQSGEQESEELDGEDADQVQIQWRQVQSTHEHCEVSASEYSVADNPGKDWLQDNQYLFLN